ncbi:CD209 antigen-like protein E isoform X2 [Astatotilapia calliptera]|uniref:C-type lectin domain-containing protein n=1 Tax=Astatotilapia calliptera TaxID=8154 RepID=A0A3P8PJF7_ASTCA|nr:CD209 antigen-like protein E isoform X2 [Astatotilapia calliptera]
MSSDIYAKPDLSKKVRYSRKEDGAEWEQREVDIYESTDEIRDSYDHFQSQEGGPQTQNPPSVLKGSFRCATLGLRVLCLLMLAGIIILSICYALNKSENNKLHFKHNKLNHSYNELQTEHQETKRLNSQLQEEVKKLKEKIEEKCPEGWTRFGSKFYFKSTENKTWSDSRRACQDIGADLVMINSKEEQEFVSNFRGFSWIGLRANQTSGRSKWEWVDGSALTETFRGTGWSDPYSGYRGVCCDDDGRWTRSYYSESKTFICEK